MDNMRIIYFHFFWGLILKLTCMPQASTTLTAERSKLEMCRAVGKIILRLKCYCKKIYKMDLVRADGWELTWADLSTHLIPKGISRFRIAQPWPRTWLLCILQQKPLATHNRRNWRPNRENLVGSCQSKSKSPFYKPLPCCAGSVCCFW